MKLSIIIPVYKVEDYIVRCVESALHQNTDDYEIVIVNDGTPDRSIEVLNEKISDSRIRIINQNNQGLSAARNTGIVNARGEYLWFVDSDDWIEKDCISKIIKRINETSADVVYIMADEIIGDKVFIRGQFTDIGVISGKVFLEKFRKYYCAPLYIVRRSLLNKNNIKFYLNVFHEDNDYTPRMLYYTDKITSIKGYFYHIFRHEGSITMTPNPKRLFDLLKIAEHYKELMLTIPLTDRYLFCNVIGSSINQAMFECNNYSKDIQRKINDIITKGKYARYLCKSNILKYRIEGILFFIFPNNCLNLYNFLQLFNRNKGGQKTIRIAIE